MLSFWEEGIQLSTEPGEAPEGSGLCPAPVWWTAGAWAAACTTDLMWLCPNCVLKYIYVFIAELVPKHDSLSCLLSLLSKRQQGQLEANYWCGWNWAVSHKLSWSCSNCNLLPRSCSAEVCVWTILHVVSGKEDGGAMCALSALFGIPAAWLLLQVSTGKLTNLPGLSPCKWEEVKRLPLHLSLKEFPNQVLSSPQAVEFQPAV